MSKEYENQNVSYVIHGNYHLPCITVKEQNELHIGVWANRHRQYLKQHHCIRYYNLLTSERLYTPVYQPLCRSTVSALMHRKKS